MAECLNDLNLQTLWECEISEEDENYINDKIVPLNCMVRECYLKYLKRTLSKNLDICPDLSNVVSEHDLEKCTSFLELRAIRLCMVTNLYQRAMLQMVSEIKKHTKQTKLYYRLEEVLQKNCSCKVSKSKTTQTNFLELKVKEPELNFEKESSVTIKTEFDEKETCSMPDNVSHLSLPENNSLEKDDVCESSRFDVSYSKSSEDTMIMLENSVSEMQERNIVENSLDKTEEAEAMEQLDFCLNGCTESNDFGKVLMYDSGTQELIKILESDDENSGENISKSNGDHGSECMESINDSVDSHCWPMEIQRQRKKLHDNISKICCDPVAKVKMKNKFFDIFGSDSDEDSIWCSKEKIAKYKQRIAPWVVKHLVPYYRQKRIMGRPVFKLVASHITDKLISIHHFPEETDVEKGITLFFSYHGFVGKSEDVWHDWDKELYNVKLKE